MRKQYLISIIFCCFSLFLAAQQKRLQSEEFFHAGRGLGNFSYRINKEKKATVAFFGGSITNMNGWRDKVGTYLTQAYPDTHFELINAGIPSLGSLPHAFRFNRDVLSHGRVDLLFLETAVNDHVNGTNEITQRRALEGIIRQARKANPYIDIVLMAFADEDKIADYKAGRVPLEVSIQEDITKYYKIPFINLAKEVTERIENKEFTWADDFKNLHPSPFGQEIYFAAIRTLLQKEVIDNNANKPEIYRLPPPIQKFAYANGTYVNVDQATIKKDFILNPSWKPADGAGTRAGFVNIPVLTANKPNAEIEYSFKGKAVGIAVLAGPDAGILKYAIDNGTEQTADLYTKWSKSLHLPWYILLGDGLQEGNHILKIKIADDHNPQSAGTACRIAYFMVNK